jgi:hypothetical protein
MIAPSELDIDSSTEDASQEIVDSPGLFHPVGISYILALACITLRRRYGPMAQILGRIG